MKVLSRDFTIREKIVLLLLALVLIGLAYYQFVDKPVRTSIARAENEKAALELELQTVQLKVAQLEKMQNEIDSITSSGSINRMPSYNNSKEVNKLLNSVLGKLDYAITFSNVTRSGDQIRRNISLRFTAPNYSSMEQVIDKLAQSEYRCLIGNVSCSLNNERDGSKTVVVNLTATFYETMVGGTADAGLPEANQ